MLLTESAEFTTSNPNCPVDSYAINIDIFELTTDLPTFSVKLDESKLSLESFYPYIVTAIAEGGATASVSDTMEGEEAARQEAERVAAEEEAARIEAERLEAERIAAEEAERNRQE